MSQEFSATQIRVGSPWADCGDAGSPWARLPVTPRVRVFGSARSAFLGIVAFFTAVRVFRSVLNVVTVSISFYGGIHFELVRLAAGTTVDKLHVAIDDFRRF